MYTKAANVDVYRPSVFPDEAGKVLVSDGTIEVTAAQIALNAVVGLCVLPAGCVPLDFILVEDDLDTGTALVQTVGVKDPAADDLVASTNFITSTTIGRAGGMARAATFPDALVAVSSDPAVGANAWSGDRVIAVKTTTGGVLNVQSHGHIVSTGTVPTAADYVTIGPAATPKVYTFVDTIGSTEGNVHIAASAALTLANLVNAINCSGGVAGVDYVIAAANPAVTATLESDTSVQLTAIVAGAAGDLVLYSDSGSQLSESPATNLAGGVTAVPLQAGTIRGILTYRAAEYGA